jgi:hypothetical protein
VENSDPWSVKAGPTKDFFIEMLVKDIPLRDSVVDLVDNCVDGAIRLRRRARFDGLWARVEVSPHRLRVADNCGGIPIDIAREYAFRFGRPEEMEATKHSIGQFGVGMKRAFFKLGTRFRVESTTEHSRFVVEEDVDQWRRHDRWEFRFDKLDPDPHPKPRPDERGTIIEVSNLHEGVAKQFGLENYLTDLREQLARAHRLSMERGLSITFNRIPLQIHPLELLHSALLKPGRRALVFHEDAPSPVNVELYAGVGESKPWEAGWYVFCNGRMLLEADQTITTGWGETRQYTIPKMHNQYARFRGYAFLDSDDAGLLPWNTTKTGLDTDSALFQSLRLQMIILTRPVITFLNKLKEEKAVADDERDPTPLEDSLRSAKSATPSKAIAATAFLGPSPKPLPRPPRTGTISYSKPLDQIRQVKQKLRVRSNKAVGEKTFEYFLEMECED